MNYLIKLILILTVFVLLITGCSKTTADRVIEDVSDHVAGISNTNNEYVSMVKNGYNTAYSDTTYGEAFDSFFRSPIWQYFKAESGEDVVEFSGECIYRETEVKAKIQFIINEEEGSFITKGLSFNGIPQENLILASLMQVIFTDEKENHVDESPSEAEESSSDAVVMSDFMIITAKIAAEMIEDAGGEYQFLATESDGQGFMEYHIDNDNSIILVTDGTPSDYTAPGYQMISAVSVYPSETTADILICEDISIYMNIDDLYNAFGKSNVDFKPDTDFDGAFTATVLTDYGEITCSWWNGNPNNNYPDMIVLKSLDY